MDLSPVSILGPRALFLFPSHRQATQEGITIIYLKKLSLGGNADGDQQTRGQSNAGLSPGGAGHILLRFDGTVGFLPPGHHRFLTAYLDMSTAGPLYLPG